jgi:DNA-binding IclR family transcriptional regulator
MLWGVSAPVFNAVRRPVAVVSVWGSSRRVRRERFAALGALVVDAAGSTARALELA